MNNLVFREEALTDIAAIRAVHEAAFRGPGEADLVNALRQDGDLLLSMVAEAEDGIVGHVAYSRLDPEVPDLKASALAPVAVLPERQRKGVGSTLIRESLRRLSAAGEDVVLVLGDPGYYSRFGFSVEAARGFRTPYDGPYLQALVLNDGTLLDAMLAYAPAFSEIG